MKLGIAPDRDNYQGGIVFETDTSLFSNLNYVCNSFKHNHGAGRDVIVVGEAVFKVMEADERFMSAFEKIPTHIIIDDDLPPLEGYTAILARHQEIVRQLQFIKRD